MRGSIALTSPDRRNLRRRSRDEASKESTMTERQLACKWRYQTKGRLGRASPAVAQDGTVYVGDQDCLLYAISSEGRLAWKRRTAGRLNDSTASVTNDNAILVASETGRVSAFSAAGDVLWGSNSDWFAVTSPVTAEDGSVILGARKHNEPSGQPDRLVVLDRWGNKMWEMTTQGEVSEAPVIGAEGAIYFGTHKGYFYSVTPEGQIRWLYRVGARIASAPAITEDGLALIGAYDGCLYAISPEMKVAWQFHAGAMIYQCSPAIAADGTIYFGSWDHCLYALSSGGRLKWKFATERPILSSPAVADDGAIYFGSQDRRYYALYPDGSLKWELRTDSPVLSSPAIMDGGDVVICANSRSVMALDEQNGGPAMSGWPMFLGGPRRNGQCFKRSVAKVVKGGDVKSVRNGFIAGPSLEAPGGS
jgi:large repetitive protein